MKTSRLFMLMAFITIGASSCSLFKPKYGCPSNGANVGAEKLLSDPKAAKKAKKFKA